MLRLAAILVLSVGLAACDVISTLKDGWRYADAVQTDLEASTGLKPGVAFKVRTSRLLTVTVTFPGIPRPYETRPLSELVETVRRSVTTQFKQTPDDIVLAFSLEKSSSGRTAQLRETD